jgi:hypothetical protein
MHLCQAPIALVTAAATIATLSCSPATAVARRVPAGPTLVESLNTQIVKAEAMPWTLARRLTWADFKGGAPRDSGAAAETAYTLFYGVRCAGEAFEFRVVAAFRPNDSWVRPSVLKSPGDSARALRHEQTHFDISEVHARRMRRYFAELVAPCRRTPDELAAMAERLVEDERAAQSQYDKETDHSRVPAQQARWDKEVTAQLSALVKFAR